MKYSAKSALFTTASVWNRVFSEDNRHKRFVLFNFGIIFKVVATAIKYPKKVWNNVNIPLTKTFAFLL